MNRPQLTPNDFAIYTATTLVGLTAVGAGVMFISSAIRKGQAKKLEETAMDGGSAANLARRLKMAFENDMWWGMGTNEKEVFAVFESLKRKSDYPKVVQAYRTLYGSELNTDLQSELSSSDYNKVIKIYNSKPA